jgi:hypothetical protein
MAKQTFTTGQVLTAAQMTSLQQTAMLGGAASAKTASYTLVAADAGTAISMSNAGATTITVDTGLFAAGDTVHITNLGAGVCTITAGTATVNSSASLALAQYESGFLDFTSSSAAIFVKGAGAAAAAGTTLISRSAFSGSTTAIFDSVFTSTYDSYMIIIEDVIAVTGTDDLLFQFRVGSTTKNASYYGSSGLLAQGINTWTNFTSANASSVTIAVDMGTTTNIRTSCQIFVNNVGQTSERASFRGQSFNGSNANMQIFAAGNDAADTYTGFVISAGSNITGTAAIYGMRK